MISANLKTNIMKTDEEVKEVCIKELEELIQNIKDDKISDNYVYAMDVLEMTNSFEMTTGVVRYSVTRNEYRRRT
jgi:hypothetical protein|tara:strand:- start:77 stop:301 length:225 start_codon:yes stop_codon:yes gene_type:complete